MGKALDNGTCKCNAASENLFPMNTETVNPAGCGQDATEETCIVKRTIAKFVGLEGADERSSPDEIPGYTLNHFVDGFLETPAGRVPRVKTGLSARDLGRHTIARSGIARSNHRVTPGLYAAGSPGTDSPVLVTANYRLSFDALRKGLSGISAWILVLDTRGVNVWCAAGKQVFSSDEVTLQINKSKLEQVVSHRKIILPQFSATGVNGRQVKNGCGFEVVWGPVRANDIPEFLGNNMECTGKMRTVGFPFVERAVLVPVEVSILLKPALVVALFLFLISGIGPGIFSVSAAWGRGVIMVTALIAGILSGSMVTPLLLPFIPGTMFAVKGALTGIVAAGVAVLLCIGDAGPGQLIPVFLVTVVFSSFLAMNFTGATPLTSPSGVEKEMRAAMPWQVGALIVALAIWVGTAFVG